mmetsp:Transcript_1042/g.1349  ORF Transcript_1042/g.1349 Transcript_1042/m.1349 type:complete len:346 (-) Transcript_1042:133-1170(-)
MRKMLKYEIADQSDKLPSIDPNDEEEKENNNTTSRLLDTALELRTKFAQHYQKPVFILVFLAIVQVLWIFGLTIKVNSFPHKMEIYSKTIEDLRISLETADSKISDLERAFYFNKGETETLVPTTQQQTEAPSLVQDEVIVGSDITNNLRLNGRKIWFQDSKEIEINEVPTPTAREWSNNNIEITVGTTITWIWTSNENLVEASENYAVKSNPTFSSGAIQHGGALSYTFETSGTYFFVSENTASMRGKIVVKAVYIENGTLTVPNINISKDGALSVPNINLSGAYSGINLPGTLHSFVIVNSQVAPCPEGTTAITASTSISSYSSAYTYAYFYGGYYLVICVYQ